MDLVQEQKMLSYQERSGKMIIKKNDSTLMKIVNVILLIITFGKQNTFMTDYITTIGEKIYVPKDWDLLPEQSKDIILFHENVHIEQYKREGFWFSLKYLFWPLPTLHAHARLAYELEAYAKDIVYSYRKYGTPIFGPRYDEVINQMTGPDYFWTCVNKKHVATRLMIRIFKEIKDTRKVK